MTSDPGVILISAFLASAGLALLLVPLARRAAFSLGIIDRPDHRLKRHAEAVPYLGGAAIFAACILTVLAAKLIMAGSPRGVVGMVAGATVVFLLGLADDFRPLSPGVKLAVQAAAACLPIAFGVHIKFIENPQGYVPLTILWLVGITNAFNLLDIMDGLAATVALAASLWFWLISWENGRLNDALTAAALAGSVLGFLRYNRPPARIFMG
ncbi:MAG: MraY family glycosyltransferase, partial [bacterium]